MSPSPCAVTNLPPSSRGFTQPLTLLVAGRFGVGWAQSVNPYFEPSVHIQSDRRHQVVATGSYAYVRHPGYIFGLIMTFGLALGLALGPAAGGADRCHVGRPHPSGGYDLAARLHGYAEFAARVRYRWIPGVW